MKTWIKFGLIGILTLIGLILIFQALFSVYNANCDYKKGVYEMRAYDSEGRITGVINGVEYRDIPDSFLFSSYEVPTENGTEIFPAKITIFDPQNPYIWEIYSLSPGNYVFSQSSTQEGKETFFDAINIPISEGETHRYHFDWDALAEGRKGATLLIDKDNDGIFEKKINSDNKLTCRGFIFQTKKWQVYLGIFFIIIVLMVWIIYKIKEHKK